MKRIMSLFIATILVFSCITAMTSCSSAEDKLLGTWEYKLTSGTQLYASSTYTFSKSGSDYIANVKMGSANGTNSYKAKYKVEGSRIVFLLDNGNDITENYSLNGKTLTIGNLEYTKK